MQNQTSKKLKNSASGDLVLQRSTSSLEKLDENFYGAFQQHYEFLMDKGLIETCQHTGAQKIDNQDSTVNVSYREFIHQFNQIKIWLDQFRNFKKSSSSLSEKYSNQIFYEEILKRSPRRELLNEYACHLINYHPDLKHDVLSKLHYLNKQWKSIESIVSKRYFNQDMAKDIGEDLKSFQLWLNSVENSIHNLSIKPEWTLVQIEQCLNEHKCLQNDIESHSKIINSVLKLSAKLNQEHKEYDSLYENGMYLQNKWHCLWLNSLEWQCRLEQEINRLKKEQIKDASDKSNRSSESSTFVPHSQDTLPKNTENDDIIPFDESEYEKILTSSTATTLDIRPKATRIKFFSSDSLASSRQTRSSGLTKAMSCTNIFDSLELGRKIPSSLTESDIPKRVDFFERRKKRRFGNHTTNDLSYYYSLTDVKYYSLDDDDDDEQNERQLNASDLSSNLTSGVDKSDSSSSLSSLDLSSHRPYFSKGPTKRSSSDFNLRPTRVRRYSNKKYFAPKRRKPIDLNETGGHDADLDDNLEEADEFNSDQYDYDNSHELIGYDQQLLTYTCSNKKTLRKLNTTATSAYDTCSNLSNEVSSSEKAFRAKSGRSSSGNASGDFNDDYSHQIQVVSFTESSNFDNFEPTNEAEIVNKKIEPICNATCGHEPAIAGVDETSTTNTDVSDPHWDGYTSSPLYSNSATVDDFYFSGKNQPVLPWDELFFELDPNEDIPQKQNTNHCTLSRQRTRFTRRVSTPGLNQASNFFYHENRKPKLHRKLTEKKDSLSSFECSSSNETTTSDLKSSFGHRRNMSFTYHYRMLEVELNELEDIIKDSEDQLNHVTKLNNWHKNLNFEFKPAISILNLTESNRLTASNSLDTNYFNLSNIPKYNDLLAICHTNISNLKLIRNLIKTSNFKDSTDTVQPTFTYHYELKQHQRFQQFKQQKLDSYLFKLDEIVHKWEMMDTRFRESKHLEESASDLLSQLKNTKNSIDFLHNLTTLDPSVLYFRSIDNLQFFIEELEDKQFYLSDILNKINEHRSNYLSLIAKHKTCTINIKESDALLNAISEQINTLEENHKEASLELKVLVKNLENLKTAWQQLEDIEQEIEKEMSEFKGELVQDCSDCKSSCTFNKNHEATVKNLKNKNLLDMLDMNDLDNLESKLTVMATRLDRFNRELTNLFKFSQDNITETDLECVSSNYSLSLDKFSNETKYLKELCNFNNRNETEINAKCDLNDQNSKRPESIKSFNYENLLDFLPNFQLDVNSCKIPSDFNELMTSTPRPEQFESVNKICPVEDKEKKSELIIEDKSCQTDTIDKNFYQKCEDSGIIASTDNGYFSKLESSTDNVNAFKSELKDPGKINNWKKDQDYFMNDLNNLELKLNVITSRLDRFNRQLTNLFKLSQIKITKTDLESVISNFNDRNETEIKTECEDIRKRNVEKIEKIDEVQCSESEIKIQNNEKNNSPVEGCKFSFYKILLSGFFLALLFVFFLYLIIFGFKIDRNYLFFNIETVYEEDDDQWVFF